jgi:hypothetical protein
MLKTGFWSKLGRIHQTPTAFCPNLVIRASWILRQLKDAICDYHEVIPGTEAGAHTALRRPLFVDLARPGIGKLGNTVDASPCLLIKHTPILVPILRVFE